LRLEFAHTGQPVFWLHLILLLALYGGWPFRHTQRYFLRLFLATWAAGGLSGCHSLDSLESSAGRGRSGRPCCRSRGRPSASVSGCGAWPPTHGACHSRACSLAISAILFVRFRGCSPPAACPRCGWGATRPEWCGSPGVPGSSCHSLQKLCLHEVLSLLEQSGDWCEVQGRLYSLK